MKTTSNQAIQTALTGDWAAAVEINKEILEGNPKDVEALNRMGLAYMILGKSKNARESYLKVLEIDPLNSIAIRNLKKITGSTDGEGMVIQVNNIFLEETGKTKVIELINLAQSEVLLTLQTGQAVDLSIRRLKIFISQGKKYIGVLPDDVGKRLIRFISGGNKYEAYVKSASHQGVSIFIRELKKVSRFKDQPSFFHLVEKKLNLKKSTKDTNSYEEDESESPTEEE